MLLIPKVKRNSEDLWYNGVRIDQRRERTRTGQNPVGNIIGPRRDLVALLMAFLWGMYSGVATTAEMWFQNGCLVRLHDERHGVVGRIQLAPTGPSFNHRGHFSPLLGRP